MAYIAGLQYTGAVPGTIIPFSGAAPSLPRTLFCDGSAVSRTTYADLFAVIGTAYGTGDGSTTFNLPDLRYTFLRGRGPNISQIGTGNIAATVNFTDAGDLVTLANHGLTNGSIIQFRTITTTTGISINTNYYVINATTNNFQLSSSLGGAPLPLTNNGTGVFRNFGIFTNHGIKRTGMRVKITGTIVAPLNTTNEYYAIVVNENNIAFATTYANALTGLAGSIAITTPGTSIASTTVIQNEDPDIATRNESAIGGNNAANVGSRQPDAFQNHIHKVAEEITANLQGGGSGKPDLVWVGYPHASIDRYSDGPYNDGGAWNPRTSSETRPNNVYINYCIAY
jgi:microcystin-dependent protein